MLKVTDNRLPSLAPAVELTTTNGRQAGETITFKARRASGKTPLLKVVWSFGDGITLEGLTVNHTYTHAGPYTVHVRAAGLDGTASEQALPIAITGALATGFKPQENRRFDGPQ
jgi:PKD repeat protein